VRRRTRGQHQTDSRIVDPRLTFVPAAGTAPRTRTVVSEVKVKPPRMVNRHAGNNVPIDQKFLIKV
jgi:hypothetical protein